MPFDIQYWAGIAALISGLADSINLGIPVGQAIIRRREEPRNLELARTLQVQFSTYSDEEVEAIEGRLKSCRDRFVNEGSGKIRLKCLCSVLQDVKDGNGGKIPVEEWERAFRQLNCAE